MATADLSALDRIAAALRCPSAEPLPADWRDYFTSEQFARKQGITTRAANYILTNAFNRGEVDRRMYRVTPGHRPSYIYRPAKKRK